MSVKKSLKERQRKEREYFILQEAEEILLQKGYYETSMDEIAERVGISKGTLYLHFAKKEDLVFAVIKPKMDSFLQTVETARSHPGTAKEKLELLLRKEISGAFFQFLMKSSTDMAALFKSQTEQINKVMSLIFSGISEIMEEGKSKGVFDRSIPTTLMSSTFINLFDPYVYKQLVMDQQLQKEDFVRYIIQIYFRGIQL